MDDLTILSGKKILIVDDELDVLDTLLELLDVCLVDTAPNFETAEKFLSKNMYDVAIFDIMYREIPGDQALDGDLDRL